MAKFSKSTVVHAPSISANADEVRNAASRKIDHIARTAHQVQLPGNKRQPIANCYADQKMSVITTHLNDNAQTPLNRFVVHMLYSQLCNKYSDKSNR